MTYEVTFFVNALLGAALVALTVGAVVLVPAPGAARGARTWSLLAVSAAAALVVVGKVVNAGQMSTYGWVFAERTLRWDVPLVGLPVLALLLVTIRARASRVVGTPAAEAQLRARMLGLGVWASGTTAGVFVEEFFLRRPVLLVPIAAVAAVAGALSAYFVSRTRDGSTGARRLVLAASGALVAVLLASLVGSWFGSRLPGSYDLGALAVMDTGTGARASHDDGHRGAPGDVSVATLTGPRDRPADVSYTLVAQRTSAPGAPFASASGLSFNGQVPGPALTAREGDLIEVVLRNKDIAKGVSVHWHGYDVPNAEDGVAGVTQDAVAVGGTHTYRFLAEQVGTFWYHSHQVSSEQVERGLFGSLIVLPRTPAGATDVVVVDHGWRGGGGFLAGDKEYDAATGSETRVLRAGTQVRLRLINTQSKPQRYRLVGTDFRVAAIDGVDLNGPEPVRERALLLAAGGRYDLSFVMPPTAVRLTGLAAGGAVVLAEGETAGLRDKQRWPDLDPARYGAPDLKAARAVAGPYDRTFTMDIDRRLGLIDGRPGYFWTVNGYVYPRMPMFMVSEGDLVKVTIINRTLADHPIHLHGHHMRVLERGGRAVTGSPWSSDTLNVAPGERYVVAFRADNPGIWMDHCHDLQHAAQGFVMHVGYVGVSTPFRIGSATANVPE